MSVTIKRFLSHQFLLSIVIQASTGFFSLRAWEGRKWGKHKRKKWQTEWQTYIRRGGGRKGEKQVGEKREEGEKIGERQSHVLFTARCSAWVISHCWVKTRKKICSGTSFFSLKQKNLLCLWYIPMFLHLCSTTHPGGLSASAAGGLAASLSLVTKIPKCLTSVNSHFNLVQKPQNTTSQLIKVF